MPAQYCGVIPTAQDMKLYEEASDPNLKEDATASFWFAVLLFQFPVTSGYRFTPERHPAIGSLQRVDMDVYALRDQDRHTLLFVEWKTAAKDTPIGRIDAQRQVLGYCKEYLDANPCQPSMHAMVCAGPHARIWKVNRFDECLTRPERLPNEPNSYVDAKTDSSNVLAQGFEEIRRSKPVCHNEVPPQFITKT